MRFTAAAGALALALISSLSIGAGAQQGPPPPPPPPPMAPPSMPPAQSSPPRDNTGPPRPFPTGTASISGTVVNDITDRPVRRATVTLQGADAGVRLIAVTGDDGRFAFDKLPANRYTISTSRPSYVSATFGARRPGRPGTPVAVVDAQSRNDVVLRLIPGAVITGTVRSQNGEPLPGARVLVLRQAFSYTNGERTLQPAGSGLGNATDDRGEYRIYGLAPDTYYIVVTTGFSLIRSNTELRTTTAAEVEWATRQLQGRTVGGSAGTAPPAGIAIDYAPLFYPGSSTQDGATPVIVKAGETRTGIDVIADATPTASIKGTVVSVSGDLPPSLMVNVIAHDTIPGVPFSGFGSARVDRTGKFISANMVPGTYTVTVRAIPGAGGAGAATSALWGTATIFVNGSDVETTVPLQTGVSVSGRVAFDESTAKPPDLNGIRMSLSPIAGKVPTLGVAAVPVDASGTFTLKGVTPGRYRLSPAVAQGWRARTATLGDVDWLDTTVEVGATDIQGVEVRFTDKQTEIAGALLDATDRPAQDFFIIVYASDTKYWGPLSRRVRMTRPGSDGRYKVADLPPGEYYIAALTDVEQNEWLDPAFLTQLVPASTKVALAEGEKKEQSLRIK